MTIIEKDDQLLYVGPTYEHEPIAEFVFMHQSTERDPRSVLWMRGFADAYVATGLDYNAAAGYRAEYAGNAEYGTGYNAGTDLAMFHNNQRQVIDPKDVL